MKSILKLFLVCISAFFLSCAYADHTRLSPVGYWQTLDDVTGKPNSILHIYQAENILYGKVVKAFPLPGQDPSGICKACKGSKHNQRIVGMVIMQGLTQSTSNPAEWSGGEILDPVNGKTYRCSLTVVNKGNTLNARGYIGISLFGRTQTWQRVNSTES